MRASLPWGEDFWPAFPQDYVSPTGVYMKLVNILKKSMFLSRS